MSSTKFGERVVPSAALTSAVQFWGAESRERLEDMIVPGYTSVTAKP